MRKSDRPQKFNRAVATIETIADIRKGVAGLRKLCPAMRRVHDLVGDPPLRRLEPGFAGLAQVVVSQQLSVASAGAIWKRTAQLVEPFDAATLLGHDVARLRAVGLSQGKVKTLRAVADAIVSGALLLDGVEAEEGLREALLAVNGIGPWTADIYVMFCLGAQDGFAAGDLALQLAAQRAMRLEARPGARELIDIAERWRPWRGIAARLLWSLHAHRDRDV